MWRSLANRKLGLQLTNEKDESEIELTKIDVKFCQQMKSSTVFPESSALRLRRSISNTVERKPLDDITLHEACKDHLVRDIEELLSDPSCDVNGFDARGLTALHYAAKNDLDDVTKILLENGADVDIHDPCNRSLTPLQMACWFNSYDTVRLLLANGADVNKNSRYGQLAIHYAASRSGVEIVEELLVKGKANPNGKDNSGFTPLHIAAARGRLEIVNALLKHGANITLQDNDGYTPVHIASREGHVTTLRALLQSALATGVSMRYILESTGAGSCLQLAVKKCHIETAKVCLEYGASTYGNAHDTTPPLHTACIHGNLDMVQLLVMSGASIDAEDIEGMTPILRASLFGHAKIVNFLIDQGANLEAAGPGQPSPLMCAVTKGHADVIKLLLSRGCSIDVRDASHRTCVHVAVYSENERTLDTLLEYGGKILVNSQDKSECTPLHFAAINRSLKMILKLLDFGADTNILDDEEKLPLHHAAEAGDLECFQALVVVNPSSIHKTDLRLRTALYYAALENKDDIIKFLIESGAHVNSRDDDRLTPLLAIAPSGCAQTVTMLLDHGAKIDDLSKNRATALTVASIYGNTDVVKVLLDRGASIDGDWSIGHGCLASAIRGGQKQTCMEIIKHKRWKEALKVKGSQGFTCMKDLIEHFPEVAKLALDKCIVTSSNLAPTDENYSVSTSVTKEVVL